MIAKTSRFVNYKVAEVGEREKRAEVSRSLSVLASEKKNFFDAVPSPERSHKKSIGKT